jgi:AAA domain
VPFNDPDPFRELRFPSILAAKLAIADYLGRPLAKLAAEDLGYIEALLKETLERRTIITCVRGQGELRERELRNLVRKRKKPIVLMVDEAHDLHHHTLTGLKRLIEMVADGDGKLCVLLAGHPKLRRDLRNPTMEEIGYRTAVFSLEGVTGSQREYIEWMLATCAADKAKVDAILDPAAVDLLASRLRTPLQIEQHLTLALETGYQASEKPVGEAIVDSVLSKQIDDLEPTLTRHGYTAKVLTEMLGTKPGEIKALFKQTLEVDRARELKEQMLAAGLPL